MVRSWCFRFAALAALAAGCNGSHAPGSVPQGGSCEYDRDCAPVKGAIPQCACGASGDNVCGAVSPVPVGCGDASRVCSDTETCTFDAAHPNGACVPDATAGQPCDATNCMPGLFCNASQVCEAAHAAGQPCNPDDQTSCAAPAFCDTKTSTCQALRAVGQPCDPGEIDRAQCVSGAGCSLVKQVCVTPEPNGSPCPDDVGCLSGYCDPSGTCQTRSCDPGGGFGD
jgi:hypothetical protein